MKLIPWDVAKEMTLRGGVMLKLRVVRDIEEMDSRGRLLALPFLNYSLLESLTSRVLLDASAHGRFHGLPECYL